MDDAGYSVRAATLDDLDDWHAHLRATLSENGRGGRFFMPFTLEQAEQRFTPERVATARDRLARPLEEVDWLRVFLLVTEAGKVAGHADLNGGKIVSELHRTTLGLGVESMHHRRGLGTRLVAAAIEWAVANGLSWMDLGVFAGNDRAIALYRKLGFVETGRADDRFRVGDVALTDISMTLRLARRTTAATS